MSLKVLLLMLAATLASASQSPVDLLANGRVDDAIVSLNHRLQQDPDDAEAYHLLCRAHFDFQDWNSAVSACERAVSLDPKSSRDHLWLGRAYGEKADSSSFFTAVGLAKKARGEFEAAVQIDPSNAEARSDLAEFYLEAPGIVGGGRDKAAEQAEALNALNSSKAHWIKGRIAEKNKDKTAAESEYRAAIAASHGRGIDWLNLAFFYKRTHRLDEMEHALRQAVAAPPEQPEVIMEAGETLVRANRNLPLAMEWLHQYLSGPMVELAPAFKAYYWLGQAQEKQADPSAAMRSYRTALALATHYSRAQEALNRIDHQQ